MIEVQKLVKLFKTGGGDLIVLRGLNLSVQSGEFLAITGRSGSGKSTLLYQLGLLDRPTSGEIWIDKIHVTKLSEREQTHFRLHYLGYVFQDYALIPELTAEENVAVPLMMQGYSRKEANKKADKVLNQVGLGDKLHNLPSALSGGQQQRVAIARALGHNPKIIFADEPTANLDSETSKTILEVFKELNKAGQTIVMVTHEEEYALIADRVITLSDGIIIDEEAAKQFLN